MANIRFSSAFSFLSLIIGMTMALSGCLGSESDVQALGTTEQPLSQDSKAASALLTTQPKLRIPTSVADDRGFTVIDLPQKNQSCICVKAEGCPCQSPSADLVWSGLDADEGTKCFLCYKGAGPETCDEIGCDQIKVVTTND